MQHQINVLSLAVIAFVSTNVDDLFVLVSFFLDPKFKARQVIIGQYLGIATLYGLSLVGSLISLVLAPQYVGFLGLVPILIGARKLYEWMKGQPELENRMESSRTNAKTLEVAAVTFANGGDNVAIYAPFFAAHTAQEVTIIGVVFGLMTGAWIFSAHWLVNHRTLGIQIRRYGAKLVPFVFIALGLSIMIRTGSLALIRNLIIQR